MLTKKNLSAEEVGSIIFSALSASSKDIYQCTNCGRVHIQEEIKSNKFISLAQENETPKFYLMQN